MTGIKFDEEKIKNCIKSFHDINGRYPYLICSSETRKIIPKEEISNIMYITSSSMIVGNVEDGFDTWYKSKILIDDKLSFGEVIIA